MKKTMTILLLFILFLATDRTACASMPGDSGRCGEHATWSLGADGIVTISGSGTVTRNYPQEDDSYPFPSVYDIQTIIIEEGITELADGFFKNCPELTQITLPDSLQKIGDRAFYKCQKLTSIRIPKNLSSIGSELFYENYALRKLDNLSSLAISTESAGAEKKAPGLVWSVKGRQVPVIPPQSSAVAIPRTYQISYVLHGGALTSKKITTYTYGEKKITLPKAKKKGVIFTGWYLKNSDAKYGYIRKLSGIHEALTLHADFKKIQIKKQKNGIIQIKMTAKKSMKGYRIQFCYATKKTMKNGTTFHANAAGTYENLTYRTGKKTDTVLIKNLKKNQTCYFQFWFYDETKSSSDDSSEEGSYAGEPVFYKTQI